MARQFSIPAILRMVPNDLLREFFEQLGHDEFDPKWEALGPHEIDPLLDYVTDLPASQANVMERELRLVYELSCDSGIAAIAEAAKIEGQNELPAQVPEALSVHGRAMWTRLHHTAIFETAALLHQIDNLSWWRKRNDLPASEPDLSEEAVECLEWEISSMLKSQGRGRYCTVETYSRGNVDYFFAYPDDFVETAHIHDDAGRLVATPIRKTMQVVLAYDREEGTLESYAKLNKSFKEHLERIFARCILHWDLGEHEPEQAYELDHLKEKRFALATDPMDRVRAEIIKIGVTGCTSSREIQLKIDRSNPDDSIQKMVDECLASHIIPLWQWKLTRVSICFEFLPMPGRRHGHQTIEISCPRSCSLRSAQPERVEIMQKYLKQWSIDVARSDQDRAVSVGA